MNIVPLTPKTRPAFEQLMGPKGGYGGCWCMLWRKTKAEHDRDSGNVNRSDIARLAAGDLPPGLIALDGERPAGWISVAPRQDFIRLENSRVLKPVDDRAVWSVSCFLIAKDYRRQGLAVRLLEAACDFVRERGGTIIEGYPIAPNKTPYPAAYAWTGFEAAFKQAGFGETVRRSPTRPIMRKFLD